LSAFARPRSGALFECVCVAEHGGGVCWGLKTDICQVVACWVMVAPESLHLGSVCAFWSGGLMVGEGARYSCAVLYVKGGQRQRL